MEKVLENKKKYKEKKKINWGLLPLQFILAVLPLIMYSYAGYSGYGAYAWFSEVDFYVDAFLHGKMIVFMVLSAVVLVLAVYKTVKLTRESRKTALCKFIPLFLYMGFVLLSTICTVNTEYSLYGSMDAKEPVGVLIGYVVVAFYAYLVIESKEDIKPLISAAVLGGFCMAFVGVLQAIGKDPLLLEAVQRMFTSREFIENFGYLELHFPEGQAYATLFNSNYVGTYVAMYEPLMLLGLFWYKEWWKKTFCGVTFVGLLIILFASQSRTGLIASIGVAVLILIFLSRELWKRWYVVIPGITFILMSFSLMDTYYDNLMSNRLKSMFSFEDNSVVKGVDTTGNGVSVLYKDTEYTVCMPVSGMNFNYVVFEGDAQIPVRYNEDKSYAYFTLSNGDEIEIQTANYEGAYAFGLNINNRYLYFTNQLVRGNYKIINTEFGRLDECIYVENALPGYENVASNRGFAWGRSIPLLKTYFVVGSGPDTFGIVFPQNDYVAKYKTGLDTRVFTRPHNFYLQMGVQTGTLSLVAFLVFYIIYAVGSCRRYFSHKFNKIEQWSGFAVFACTIGFLASGIANDSLIVVTPIFYVLLGTGMAINHKLCPVEKKVKKSEEEGLE